MASTMSSVAPTTSSSNDTTSATASNPIHPAILYNDMKKECNQLVTKIVELEIDRNEHILVEETLKPLDPNRRAYRLVGEILVERTVAEVLPSVVTNRKNMDTTIQNLRELLAEKERIANDLKSEHNLQE